MASRFTCRDYSNLRTEIINFLRQRLPSDWDYTNLSDPVVIFAESLARLGDQLHFTIDELRRECDMATARRASSVYSYAMREGYKMMLPKCSFGTLSINCAPEKDDSITLTLKKFDEIAVESTGNKLYVATENDSATGLAVYTTLHSVPSEDYINSLSKSDYEKYVKALYSRTAHVNVVIGEKGTYNFTYYDINSDSTVDLPDPFIDRDLLRLTVTDNEKPQNSGEWQYVDDVISAGFSGKIFTLTPKFIGGAVSLCIEFASNFADIFSSKATFKFEYVKIVNSRVEQSDAYSIKLTDYTYDSDLDDKANSLSIIIDVGSGIKGYTEYEDPSLTRTNYKKFTQNYSALLTKNDYLNYITSATSLQCNVYDHSDNWKENVLPRNADLIDRTIYITTDATYKERETLFYDLQERSSRSDCFFITPYGKDPYSIIVKAECYLLGTSVSSIITQIKASLLNYYSGFNIDNPPNTSKISYLVHRASNKVARVESCIVRDTSFGSINTDFNSAAKLSNDDVDLLYKTILSNKYTDLEESEEKRAMLESYLKGNDGGQDYLKYPLVTYGRVPDSFPKIYADLGQVQDLDENPPVNIISNYSSLVSHQLIYGDFDNPLLDVDDSEIFTANTVEIDNIRTKAIKESYIRHHYMVPYLNRVIVLVKAIDE